MESQENNLETGQAKLLTRPDVNVADMSKTKVEQSFIKLEGKGKHICQSPAKIWMKYC